MAQVQLILREEVYRLGEAGDLVSVKPGYARNFLLPQGKAMLATPGRVKELEHQKRVITEKLAKELSDLVIEEFYGLRLATPNALGATEHELVASFVIPHQRDLDRS